MRHLTLHSESARSPAARRAILSLGRNPRAGFTIAEVALAAFVMAFSIATSIIVMQKGFQSLDVARDSTLAAQIMQSEIERLRLMPWSKTTGGSPEPKDSILELVGTETVSLSSMFSTSAALSSKFTVTRTVEADSARPSDVCNITVTVTWKGYDGRSHSRS